MQISENSLTVASYEYILHGTFTVKLIQDLIDLRILRDFSEHKLVALL